ncbi:DUF6221 family protein (plasmid) [Streptomyces sp. NBC_01259]|uniref:DUF6221 family protein n=1 Tax=Streptomyces sp. NBC_01259 TaxID=2903800 RepID=UPI002F90A09E
MTDELVQFLRDRFAIEEQVAKDASPGPWHINPEADEVLAVDGIVVAEGFALSGHQLRATTEHIARHDPARVLADIDGRRRILNDYEYYDAMADPSDAEAGRAEGLTYAVQCLALPYATHPDYRPEWRP